MSSNSDFEKSVKLRAMINEWVGTYDSKNNIRMLQLSESSIHTNRKVFDDYSHGLKLFVTKVKVTEPQFFNDKNTPSPSNFEDYTETEYTIISQQNEKPKNIADDLSPHNNIKIEYGDFPIIEYKTTPIDQDYYDTHFRKIISGLFKNTLYREIFKKSSTLDKTKQYLKLFYKFTDDDFKNGHQYPFANLFIIETHISLAYYFAQYLEDRHKITPFLKDWKSEGHGDKDVLGIKAYRSRLKETRDQLIKIQKLLQSPTYFGGPIYNYSQERNTNISELILELDIKIAELSRYSNAGETICESLLAARITSDLLSLEFTNSNFLRLSEREIEYYSEDSIHSPSVFDGDVYYTAGGLGNIYITTSKVFSYCPPKDSEENSSLFHSKLAGFKNIKSFIVAWCKEITDDRLTDDIARQAIGNIKK